MFPTWFSSNDVRDNDCLASREYVEKAKELAEVWGIDDDFNPEWICMIYCLTHQEEESVKWFSRSCNTI